MNTDKLIEDCMVAMNGEGVEMAVLGEIEARLVTLLHRARNVRNAASMLPLYGAQVAAERLGCHKSTVYRWSEEHAEQARKKVA